MKTITNIEWSRGGSEDNAKQIPEELHNEISQKSENGDDPIFNQNMSVPGQYSAFIEANTLGTIVFPKIYNYDVALGNAFPCSLD